MNPVKTIIVNIALDGLTVNGIKIVTVLNVGFVLVTFVEILIEYKWKSLHRL